jgi:hypothetical protein
MRWVMKYFRVEAENEYYLGYNETRFFIADSEKELEVSKPYLDFLDEYQEYLTSQMDEEFEEYDDADSMTIEIIEITKEEFDFFEH